MSAPARSTPRTPVTASVPPYARFDALDAVRGLAVLGMIGVHLAGTEGGVTAGERAFTSLLAAVEPTVGALFCLVAGISWTIQAQRVGVTPDFRRYFALRALALAVFGVAFHVLFWSTEILVPFALMMVATLPLLGRGPGRAALAAAAIIAATPLVTFLLGTHAVTDWTEDGLHIADRSFGLVTLRYLLFDGNYPLVGWLAFPLIGMALWSAAACSRARLLRWLVGAALVAAAAQLVAALAAHHGEPGAAARFLAARWTPTSPTFALAAGGWALALVAALLWRYGTTPVPRALLPVVLIGRTSLSHYVLHIAVAYAALRVWYPYEDWPVSVGMWATAAYLALGVPLTALWLRRHRHGPLEALWARAARRPAAARASHNAPAVTALE